MHIYMRNNIKQTAEEPVPADEGRRRLRHPPEDMQVYNIYMMISNYY